MVLVEQLVEILLGMVETADQAPQLSQRLWDHMFIAHGPSLEPSRIGHGHLQPGELRQGGSCRSLVIDAIDDGKALPGSGLVGQRLNEVVGAQYFLIEGLDLFQAVVGHPVQGDIGLGLAVGLDQRAPGGLGIRPLVPAVRQADDLADSKQNQNKQPSGSFSANHGSCFLLFI